MVSSDTLDCGKDDQCGDGDKGFPNVGLPCRKHALTNARKWGNIAEGWRRRAIVAEGELLIPHIDALIRREEAPRRRQLWWATLGITLLSVPIVVAFLLLAPMLVWLGFGAGMLYVMILQEIEQRMNRVKP